MSHLTATNDAVALRPGRPGDAAQCGRICYEGFRGISGRHNFPADFPSEEAATGLLRALLAHPGFFGVVAEVDGRVAGSNFLDERCAIAGVGPITVDPQAQDRGVGRALMEAVLARARERGAPGVRLLQAAYHGRSLALYASLGFTVREPVACLQGPPIGATPIGYRVRRAEESDLEDCNRVCAAVHGHHRGAELADAIRLGTARLVERDGRVTGYATDLAFFAHAVGESDGDVMALIASAREFGGPGILVPMRNAALLRGCLEHGLRVVQPLTLMSIGLYNEPRGAWLPSILY